MGTRVEYAGVAYPTKILGIGGAPASGKSTIVKQVIGRLGSGLTWTTRFPLPGKKTKCPITASVFDRGRIVVLGDYRDGLAFPGTDRLSMAAPAVIMAFLADLANHNEPPAWVVFEGQRFFSAKLLPKMAAAHPGSKFFLVDPPEEVLAARRVGRRDTQGNTFRRAAATQAWNAALAVEDTVVRVQNATTDDLTRIVEQILGIIKPPS
jgi:hypothetical protein